ncbi:hypothetical protein GCM10022234_22810 [Aeromicrobium panaciterrae]|uniref:class I adenylate-forming enzyme family protein n=1 Tax=Aeromicrobium panaciterrae TaxID=363861 RepID=UPI0031DAB318
MPDSEDAAVTAGEAYRSRLRGLLDATSDVQALWSDGRWTTWGDVAHCAASAAQQLVALGIGPGDPVLLVLRNRPSAVAALLSCLMRRIPPVLMSYQQPQGQLVATAGALDVTAVILDREDYKGDLPQMLERMALPVVLVSSGSEVAVVVPPVPDDGIRITEGRSVDSSQVAMFVPTSGTTGTPKHVSLPWDRLPLGRESATRPAAGPEERPPVIQAMTMASITGVRSVLGAVGGGRSLLLLDRVDVDQWTKLVEHYGIRVGGLPPAAMRSMLDTKIPPDRLRSMRAWITGSAPLDPSLQAEFEEYFGVPVLVAYGSTETGGAVASWTLELHRDWRDSKLGSVGRANPGVTLEIRDESTDRPVSSGEPGILMARPAGSSTWVRTSDRALLDADDFLFVLGRADDVVIRGGFKVSLGDVEALFRQHPAVRDVGAVGLDDERLGQVPAVGVVLRTGAAVTPDQLREWAIERVVRYQVPKIAVLAELPMGATHKVNRSALRKILADAMQDQEKHVGSST